MRRMFICLQDCKRSRWKGGRGQCTLIGLFAGGLTDTYAYIMIKKTSQKQDEWYVESAN